MTRQTVAVISKMPDGHLSLFGDEFFDVVATTNLQELIALDTGRDFDLVVIDSRSYSLNDFSFCEESKEYFSPRRIPLVLLADKVDLSGKVEALEFGFDDVVECSLSPEDMATRMLNVMYHRVANTQLQDRIDTANQAAFSAMRESSNLGNNIQFLIKAHQSENLDQLGQMFFQVARDYGVSCSLQMRSRYGVKNMEANGMVKQLESELLTQFQHAGRYFDFGQRSIVNYGCVSVLVKNMPADELQYGLIKDNTFTLLQGMDARVRALDEHQLLEEEKNSLENLSHLVSDVMKGIEGEFHQLMLKIVDVVENMAESVEGKIPVLLLNEEQERFIHDAVTDCVQQSNQVFSEGLKVDRHFDVLIGKVEETLKNAQLASLLAQDAAEDTVISEDSSDVELF